MDQRTDYSNIGPSIESKIGIDLHNQLNHPIEIIKRHIYDYFNSLEKYQFDIFDTLSPFVSIEDNFDKLLIPKDHIARSKSDTYYVNENTVLRTHTSAHQNNLLSQGYENFLVVGDVYRKDEIDKSHYPVFTQMEGVIKIINDDPITELLDILGGLVKHLFPNSEYRVNNDYFPFTSPSFEIEVLHNGEWVEILGCGVMHEDIVNNNNLEGKYIAFGLGLDRYCMIAFEIPDIRYLWSTHERFIDQFSSGEICKFRPYSKLPNLRKDLSFWIPSNKVSNDKWIDENDFFELVRDICGEWIEEVKIFDEFFHPKKKMLSRAYKLILSPIDPNLKDPGTFNQKMNDLLELVRGEIQNKIDVELR